MEQSGDQSRRAPQRVAAHGCFDVRAVVERWIPDEPDRRAQPWRRCSLRCRSPTPPANCSEEGAPRPALVLEESPSDRARRGFPRAVGGPEVGPPPGRSSRRKSKAPSAESRADLAAGPRAESSPRHRLLPQLAGGRGSSRAPESTRRFPGFRLVIDQAVDQLTSRERKPILSESFPPAADAPRISTTRSAGMRPRKLQESATTGTAGGAGRSPPSDRLCG